MGRCRAGQARGGGLGGEERPGCGVLGVERGRRAVQVADRLPQQDGLAEQHGGDHPTARQQAADALLVDEEGLGRPVAGLPGGLPAAAEDPAPGVGAQRAGECRGGGPGQVHRELGPAGRLGECGGAVQRPAVTCDFGRVGVRPGDPRGELRAEPLERERGGPAEGGDGDVRRAAVAVLLGAEQADLGEPLAHGRGVGHFDDRADPVRGEFRAVQGGEQAQHPGGRGVESVEQQRDDLGDLAGPGQGAVGGGAQPGEGGGADQVQRAALGGLPQRGRRGRFVLGERAVQFAGEQVQAGGPVQSGEFDQRAVLGEQRRPVGGQHEGRVRSERGEREGLIAGQVGVVEVHGDPHPGQQAPQFGLGRGVADGVVAGLEDLLRQVGDLAAQGVEVDPSVGRRGRPVRGVAEQRAGADPGRAVQLDQSAGADRPFQLGEFGGAAERGGPAAGEQRDLFAADRVRPAAGHQEGHRGAVPGVHHQAVVADHHRSEGVAFEVEAAVVADGGPGRACSAGGVRRAPGVGLARFFHRAVSPGRGSRPFPRGRAARAAGRYERCGARRAAGARQVTELPCGVPVLVRLVRPGRRDPVERRFPPGLFTAPPRVPPPGRVGGAGFGEGGLFGVCRVLHSGGA